MEYLIFLLISLSGFFSTWISGPTTPPVVVLEEPVAIVQIIAQVEEVEEVVEVKKKEDMRSDVIYYIKKYASLYGVNQDLALDIAKCESEYYHWATNKTSSAEGTYQMIDSTWEQTMIMMGLPITTSKFEIPISVEAGIFLLATEGDFHWNASKRCWAA